MIRRIGTPLAMAVLGWMLLFGAAPGAGAQADPVFDPEDAQALADLLADATAVQGVCYGWIVQIADVTNRSRARSTGSNFGPGRSLDEAGTSCRYLVQFSADIVYARESSDFDDSASWSVTSRPRGPGTADLDQLGLFDERDLVGEEPDAALSRAIAALPQLAVNAGIATPLSAVPATTTPPDVGSLSDDPGSDYLRRAGGLLAFGAVLLVSGVAFGLFAVHSSRSRRGPAAPPTPAPPPPAPPPPAP